jgi:hypothetical protein
MPVLVTESPIEPAEPQQDSEPEPQDEPQPAKGKRPKAQRGKPISGRKG